MKVNIIYEDNHLIAVVKPNGVPVQKDISRDMDLQSYIKRYLKNKHSKPGNVFLGIVHRLDRPVGGVVVFAKTSKAASRLSDQIRKHEWIKKYVAVIEGVPKKIYDHLEDDLIKDRKKNVVKVSDVLNPESKKAVLQYRTVVKNGGRSMVEIFLETGRSHQIRVQFSSRGMPIVNDFKYNPAVKTSPGNISLWAYSIEIIHPVTKENIVLTAEMPEDMIRQLLFDQ